MQKKVPKTEIVWCRIKPANDKFVREEMQRLNYSKSEYIDGLIEEKRLGRTKIKCSLGELNLSMS